MCPGLGLTNISERLRLVGGEFSVNSQCEIGGTARARVGLTLVAPLRMQLGSLLKLELPLRLIGGVYA